MSSPIDQLPDHPLTDAALLKIVNEVHALAVAAAPRLRIPRDYAEHCRRVRADVAAATLAMSNLKEQPIGSLRITCPEVTASYFMPAFLGGFATQFPQISIELIATNAHLDLIRERVDFAFRVGSVSIRIS
jgi:DNA-binding transcriptional LysR family regulator